MIVTKEVCSLETGNFYVSVIDGERFALLAGPYKTHREALEAVDGVREIARKVDDRSPWYAFGTAKSHDSAPGLFNRNGLI